MASVVLLLANGSYHLKPVSPGDCFSAQKFTLKKAWDYTETSNPQYHLQSASMDFLVSEYSSLVDTLQQLSVKSLLPFLVLSQCLAEGSEQDFQIGLD